MLSVDYYESLHKGRQLPETSGAKHALTARCLCGSLAAIHLRQRQYSILLRAWLKELTTTVHAPHPPSAQPSFVPVRPMLRRYSSNVHSGSGCSRWILEPLTQKVIVSIHPAVRTCSLSASFSSAVGLARIEGAMAPGGKGVSMLRFVVSSDGYRPAGCRWRLCPRGLAADMPFCPQRGALIAPDSYLL